MNYKKKPQKKRGTFHRKKTSYQKIFKNWDVSIYKFVESINSEFFYKTSLIFSKYF